MGMKKITWYDRKPTKSVREKVNVYHQQQWTQQQQMRQKMRDNAAGAAGFKSNKSGTPFA